MTTIYYDKQGQPIHDPLKWASLFGDEAYKRVALDVVGDATVSTVWLGIDHGYSGRLLIFETMIFGGGERWDQYQVRYTTEAEALKGHAGFVTMIQQGQPPEETE